MVCDDQFGYNNHFDQSIDRFICINTWNFEFNFIINVTKATQKKLTLLNLIRNNEKKVSKNNVDVQHRKCREITKLCETNHSICGNNHRKEFKRSQRNDYYFLFLPSLGEFHAKMTLKLKEH